MARKGSKKKRFPAWVWRLIKFAIAGLLYLVVINLPIDMSPEQRHVLGVVVIAATLWFSEALPLFVTSLLVPVLLSFGTNLSSAQLFTPFFDPLIALFFGSFVLAAALSKHGLDKKAAALAFKYFGNSPRKLLFGLMAFVALIGMWLSNTATVAFMLPVFLLLIKNNNLQRRAPNIMKSLLLGLAYATSVDGMATIIGTPPNGIAVKFLEDAGITVSFFDWMVFGVPLLVILLPIIWLVLVLMFPPELKKLKAIKVPSEPLSQKQRAVLAIIGGTILLWVTQPLHGIESAVIALLGVFALYLFNLLEPKDLTRISWSTLLLFGGGLALGSAMYTTGVTEVLASGIVGLVGQSGPSALLLSVMGFAVLVTTFASNTAIAAIIIPVIISLAQTLGVDPTPLAIGVTLALSMDVISPLGTPPSTMVYGTGKLRVWDFVKTGVPITAIGVLVIFVALQITH